MANDDEGVEDAEDENEALFDLPISFTFCLRSWGLYFGMK